MIIPVHAHIQQPHWDRVTPNFFQRMLQSGRQVRAPALDSHKDNFSPVFVPFGDLVGNSINRSRDGGGVEEDSRIRHFYQGPT